MNCCKKEALHESTKQSVALELPLALWTAHTEKHQIPTAKYRCLEWKVYMHKPENVKELKMFCTIEFVRRYRKRLMLLFSTGQVSYNIH